MKKLGYYKYGINGTQNRLWRFLSLTGLTFIEVLIAIVITGIILASIYSGLNFANKYAQLNANKTMALNFAQGLMEEIKSKDYEDVHAEDANYHSAPYTNFLGPEFDTADTIETDDDTNEDGTVAVSEFDDVDDYNGYADTVNLYQNENTSIPAVRTVTVRDQNGSNVLDRTAYMSVQYKKITVVVSWTFGGRAYSEQVDTIVSNWQNQ